MKLEYIFNLKEQDVIVYDSKLLCFHISFPQELNTSGLLLKFQSKSEFSKFKRILQKTSYLRYENIDLDILQNSSNGDSKSKNKSGVAEEGKGEVITKRYTVFTVQSINLGLNVKRNYKDLLVKTDGNIYVRG